MPKINKVTITQFQRNRRREPIVMNIRFMEANQTNISPPNRRIAQAEAMARADMLRFKLDVFACYYIYIYILNYELNENA